ncbi:hypothetical protein CAEBREN_03515 [Caenorhabditis brenneri]|uniref:Integrase catalytic domain-containing protein n=1 Tax=Caenorhabditis brenneri TaxID=135651 RepID=G0MCE2_CAEBE|nr:hypothetical protein CAEBREN_03515 [Caenorhabditis brenneri]
MSRQIRTQLITSLVAVNREKTYTNWFHGPRWLSDNNDPDHPMKKENNSLIVPSVPISDDNKDNHKSPSDQIVYQHNRITRKPKTPILKTKSELARQIVQKVHIESHHAGPKTTLGLILEKYSGTKWRVAVKKELSRCPVCRKENNHPFSEASPGDVPERRTTESRPFQHVGVDFAGPFKTYLRNSSEVEKSYIAFFTCTTTRLVHGETVRNLSTDEFLLSLSRFMSRRGYPDSITSDNATTFKLTAEILDKCSEKEDNYLAELAFDKLDKQKLDFLEKEMAKKKVKWYFNTALAPWQGGFYERLIGVLKKALKHSLGDSLLRIKDFETIVAECESLVNRRPLTYIDEDGEDYKVLRPIDIITPGLYFAIFDENGLRDEYYEYTSNFREVRNYIKRFWDVFCRDYLTQLNTFKSIPQPNRAHAQNQVKPFLGEVVLLVDEKTPRKNWKMGIITELMKGRDGEIRSLRIRTTEKRKKRDGTLPYKPFKTIEITRPLRLVIPLELRPKSREENEHENDETEQIVVPSVKIHVQRTLKHKQTEKKMFRPIIETQQNDFRRTLGRRPRFNLWNIMMMCFISMLVLMTAPTSAQTPKDDLKGIYTSLKPWHEGAQGMTFPRTTPPYPIQTTKTTTTVIPTTKRKRVLRLKPQQQQ